MTSERWAGFTDEDIERIKSDPNTTKSCSDKICELEVFTSSSRKRGPMKIKNMSLTSSQTEQSDDIYEINSPFNERKKKEILSAIDKKVPSFGNTDEDCELNESKDSCTCNKYAFEETEGELLLPGGVTITDMCSEKNGENEELDKSSTNLLPLELFEMRQKRIEAENARRRALINKAINDKKMQTHAEAIKLAKITHELNRIDSNLSADVSTLRNYIEKASLEFSEAEKRYLKAEKEFVEAKLFLFEKMQRKEMLTEHLCAIIEQNENRKADKLVELMKQLEMEVIVDDYEVNGIEPILPNLCALNDEPYHACQTIKPTLSKESSKEKLTVEQNQKSEYEEKRTDTEVSVELIDENLPNASDVTIKYSSVDEQEGKV